MLEKTAHKIYTQRHIMIHNSSCGFCAVFWHECHYRVVLYRGRSARDAKRHDNDTSAKNSTTIWIIWVLIYQVALTWRPPKILPSNFFYGDIILTTVQDIVIFQISYDLSSFIAIWMFGKIFLWDHDNRRTKRGEWRSCE